MLADPLAPYEIQEDLTMPSAIKILTMIIVVAVTLRTILQSIVTFSNMPIKEVFIELGKFLASLDWF